MVLTSLTSTSSPSTKKSTRASPLHPDMRNASVATSRTRSAAASEISAGTWSSMPPGWYFAS